MNKEARFFVIAGCIAAMAGVICGAFGAHALKARVAPELMAVWQTGAAYHFYHALGLLGVGLVAAMAGSSRMLNWAGGLMIAGLLLFSGSLYLLALTGMRLFGALAPIGGVAWIGAWGLFAIAVWQRNPGAPRRIRTFDLPVAGDQRNLTSSCATSG